jgi:hypothetical protein
MIRVDIFIRSGAEPAAARGRKRTVATGSPTKSAESGAASDNLRMDDPNGYLRPVFAAEQAELFDDRSEGVAEEKRQRTRR